MDGWVGPSAWQRPFGGMIWGAVLGLGRCVHQITTQRGTKERGLPHAHRLLWVSARRIISNMVALFAAEDGVIISWLTVVSTRHQQRVLLGALCKFIMSG